jgi:hypothetical protein
VTAVIVSKGSPTGRRGPWGLPRREGLPTNDRCLRKDSRLQQRVNSRPFLNGAPPDRRVNGRTHVSVAHDLPRGVSLVVVKTDPVPESREDAIVISRLQVERATQQAHLHTLLQDADPGF